MIQAPGLHLKYQTRMEVTDGDKHSSLLRYGINYAMSLIVQAPGVTLVLTEALSLGPIFIP